MHSKDKYRSFRELAAAEQEGKTFQRLVNRPCLQVTIIAPHGGGIEAGTSELARAIAGNDFSLYCFEGLKKDENKHLHIMSTRFDEPKCVELVKKSQTVVAIHGCKGKSETVFVGGLDENLKTYLIQAIGITGIKTIKDKTRLAGNSSRNICNRGKSGRGVQLEITEALRRKMFKGLTRDKRKKTTPLFDKFTSSVRKALLEANLVESSIYSRK